MAFDSFGSGGGKAWQTPAPAEKPESAAAAGHSLAPTMRVGGGPTDGCSSRPDLGREGRKKLGAGRIFLPRPGKLGTLGSVTAPLWLWSGEPGQYSLEVSPRDSDARDLRGVVSTSDHRTSSLT